MMSLVSFLGFPGLHLLDIGLGMFLFFLNHLFLKFFNMGLPLDRLFLVHSYSNRSILVLFFVFLIKNGSKDWNGLRGEGLSGREVG